METFRSEKRTNFPYHNSNKTLEMNFATFIEIITIDFSSENSTTTTVWRSAHTPNAKMQPHYLLHFVTWYSFSLLFFFSPVAKTQLMKKCTTSWDNEILSTENYDDRRKWHETETTTTTGFYNCKKVAQMRTKLLWARQCQRPQKQKETNSHKRYLNESCRKMSDTVTILYGICNERICTAC